ncbi:hypothetical protein [Corallococcus sp. RDP092CA]|uniref:hypothetical protein n=1 Tax=Corallococcus sp. RDP092CA TaxID=3109369 RepID=UPI0035B29725
MRVPHGHLDGGVPHQLLDDLQRHAPHGKVAAATPVVVVTAAIRLSMDWGTGAGMFAFGVGCFAGTWLNDSFLQAPIPAFLWEHFGNDGAGSNIGAGIRGPSCSLGRMTLAGETKGAILLRQNHLRITLINTEQLWGEQKI